MKIATFNINNVNRRLSNLLEWLRASEPNVVCLQELKATDESFPEAAIRNPTCGGNQFYRRHIEAGPGPASVPTGIVATGIVLTLDAVLQVILLGGNGTSMRPESTGI